LFWLALEPPPAKQGLTLIPPLDQGGWWNMAGFFLDHLDAAVVGADVPPRQGARHGHACAPGPLPPPSGCYLVLGFIRPVLMGSWSEAVPFGIFPHLDWTAAFSIRYGNLCLQSLPRAFDRLPLRLGAAVRHARRDDPGRLALMAASARSSRSSIAARPAERAALFWRWTMGFNATMESVHRWAWWFAVLTAR
jgi:photosynthetic reaction center M subunit